MTGHQRLREYSGGLYGSPYWKGIEYDWEVPDNMVVGSPGGVSGIQHHWTKGMYSNESSTWDVYAGEGDRYVYGEFGNLYQVGQNAAQQNHQYGPAPDVMFTQNQSTAHVDNFTPVDLQGEAPPVPQGAPSGVEMLPSSDTDESVPVNADKRRVMVLNPILLFLLFAAVYFALDLWGQAGESFISSYFHKGRALSWKWLLFYAVIFTLVVFVLAYSIEVPLISIERL